jgi:hypothetical protein
MSGPETDREVAMTAIVNRTLDAVIDANPDMSPAKKAKKAAKAVRKEWRRLGATDDEIVAYEGDDPIDLWAIQIANMKTRELEDARRESKVKARDEKRTIERALADQLRKQIPGLGVDDLARYVADPPEAERLLADKARADRQSILKRASGAGGFDPSAMLTVAQLGEIADPSFVVAELVPEGSVTQVVAAPSVGKTIAMIELAVAVAVGRPAFGRLATNGPLNVAVLAGEGGLGLRRRIVAVAIHSELSAAESALLDANLMVFPKPVNLLSADDRASLRRMIDEQEVDLVIADTFSTHSPGIDENAAAEVAAVIANLRYIVAGRPKAAAIYTHHIGKAGSGSRGSSAHESNVDNAISMELKGDLAVLTMTKVKDGPAGFQMTLRKVVVELPAWTSPNGKLHSPSSSVAFEVVAMGEGVGRVGLKTTSPARFDALLAAFAEIVEAEFEAHNTPSVSSLRTAFRTQARDRPEWAELGGLRNGMERELAEALAAADVAKLGQAGLALRLYPPGRDLPPAVEPYRPTRASPLPDLDLLPLHPTKTDKEHHS